MSVSQIYPSLLFGNMCQVFFFWSPGSEKRQAVPISIPGCHSKTAVLTLAGKLQTLPGEAWKCAFLTHNTGSVQSAVGAGV